MTSTLDVLLIRGLVDTLLFSEYSRRKKLFPSGVRTTVLESTEGAGAISPGGTKETGVHLSGGILKGYESRDNCF